jgi:hypothetical protein
MSKAKTKTQTQRLDEIEEILALITLGMSSIKARLGVLEQATLINLFGGRHSISPDIHKVLALGISRDVLAELCGTKFQGNYLDVRKGRIENAEQSIRRLIDQHTEREIA